MQALLAFIAELDDMAALAAAQAVLAAGGNAVDTEAVLAALEADGEMTRAVGDAAYAALCTGVNAATCASRQPMYVEMMNLSLEDRNSFASLLTTVIETSGDDGLSSLKALLESIGSTEELTALKTLATDPENAAEIVEAVLRALEEAG